MPPTEQRPPVSHRKLGIFGVAAVVVAGLVVATGIRAREDSSSRLREWTDEQAVPTVAVALPSGRALTPTIDLPGRLEAYSRAPILARVSGYLKSWSADIGAKVKAGQVIAEIEAPDLDQQLLQARADLVSQQSSARLSEATLNRRKTLVASNFVSAQEIDERTADLANKVAAVNSGQANVERLEALAGYKKITVPFDGVVTARDTDVGALINAGGGAGPAMFVVSDITKLRVYVNVPQNFVPAIKIGAKAALTMPEYPNRTFAATVEASSQSVDISSGTTRMQLALDNSAGELMPGGYANVRLNLQRDAVPLHIPSSALIFNQNGLRVATVGPDDKVLFKAVTIARDLGKEIELASGVAADDRIITAPPDGLADGDPVRVVGPGAKGKPTASEKQDVKG
ncbi:MULTISPECIES: efflux RND transporter periplasmic adaptor subunit [Bradyrhizobium]|uniref:RND family efflux transporter, MFP subunit n=2 Tax=Bradyrhizobium TaxID=374 RepID=A0ABY0PAV9_9BRAD|nr:MULTISPECIES: efflux RND transporter periplasmic adaptor subunit [Bradyrhizobium]SDH86563.1 RND family efflux transporter, MFP subunit [Bradyrhizobium ottawaense]SEE00163.1 RND family efflux transporter, MFP subunit [Bradyrhizobium lablabi]SHL96244.1 RND family efflux transporter, MFP subunit [Bradyrhizobium lablabi]